MVASPMISAACAARRMRAVARYTNAVLTMLDERKPETLELAVVELEADDDEPA